MDVNNVHLNHIVFSEPHIGKCFSLKKKNKITSWKRNIYFTLASSGQDDAYRLLNTETNSGCYYIHYNCTIYEAFVYKYFTDSEQRPCKLEG